MSIYETRDCGHSEVVMAKKCSTCRSVLTRNIIKEIGEVLRDMEKREDTQYWFGQFCCAFDAANCDLHEFMTTGKVVPFDSDIANSAKGEQCAGE